MYVCGIDVGSAATKCVILDRDGGILANSFEKTSVPQSDAIVSVFDKALALVGIQKDDVGCVASTGYGRKNVTFRDCDLTEISAHAKGAVFLFPDTRTIIDAGGQDCKVTRLDASGLVDEFVINDRCAAGTGRFLEAMSARLGVDISKLGAIALEARQERAINSTCTVFAESEVISLLSDNISVAEVAGAVCRAVSNRLANLARRVRFIGPVTVTGGVFENPFISMLLEKDLSVDVNKPDCPKWAGALGAAHFALSHISCPKPILAV